VKNYAGIKCHGRIFRGVLRCRRIEEETNRYFRIVILFYELELLVFV
jgi:hypothetical protein